MQYGPKRASHFPTILLNKNHNKKTKQYEFFNSVFSFGKVRDSSLTYFPVFVVLYLCSDPNNESDSSSEYSPLGLTHV